MKGKDFWNKYFFVYDTLNELIPYQNLLDTTIQTLNPQKNQKVLDAGCGTGNLAAKISKTGARVTCFDSSEHALKVAAGKKFDAKFITGDLTQRLPFKEAYFDGVVSNNVIYTIPKKQQIKVIKEFFRVLKPGGKIVLVNPKQGWSALSIYRRGIRQLLFKRGFIHTIYKIVKLVVPTVKILYYNASIKKETTYYFFNPGEQKSLLKTVGFKEISSEKDVYADQAVLVSAMK